MSTAGDDPLMVDAGHGLYLVVWPERHGTSAALTVGKWPFGATVLFVAAERAQVAMDALTDTKPVGIWFGSTKITLPWLSLLAVADLLKLEIPLPVPLGEQVPA